MWLMNKSFGYERGEFRIARHQVGDFGLHLALTRSFSWGNNWPAQLPFYPGEPLPYHYGVDLAVGLMERAELRIDYALNGVSVIFFTLLLYLIYRLSGILFGPNPLRDILSVSMFLLSSNLTFVEFLKGKTFNIALLAEAWRLPDYIHKGPFDGSIISIFSSLNPVLNQRHLIVGLALSLLLLSYLLEKFLRRRALSPITMIVIGILIGISSRIHSLIAASTAIVVLILLILFRRSKLIFPFALPAILSTFPHLQLLVGKEGRSISEFLNPGFLTAPSGTVFDWLSYWWHNAGLTLIFLPIGIYLAKPDQRRIFVSFFALFGVANLFQFSWRMEHNQSIITLFFIVANIFVAQALVHLWKGRVPAKIAASMAAIMMTGSGFLNLMVVKNDFQYRVSDAPKDKLIEWVKNSTPVDAIFLARQDLYDPVTLAGRKNYLGASYYLEVMGYDIASRQKLVRQFFEADDAEVFVSMMSEGIDYVILPNGPVDNFPYVIKRSIFHSNLKPVYQDEEVTVYTL